MGAPCSLITERVEMDTQRIIALYRGWHELDGVIDFDLIPERGETTPFKERSEVLSHLIELRGESELRPQREDEQFLKAKLQSSIWYLRALMGEEIPFPLYIINTLGLRPCFISEEVIQREKEKVRALLSEFGVPKKRTAKELSEDLKLTREEAEKEAKRAQELYLPRVLALLDSEKAALPYKLSFAEKKAYWQAWSKTSEGEFELTLNFHPCQTWHKGDLEFLVLHEIGGHFLQMKMVKEAIEEGRINPALGLTTVHDPHTFVSEGIADAISYFLEIQLSPYGALAREQRKLRNFLNNNAHIRANEGEDPEKLVRYLLQHPFLREEKIRLNLKNWVQDPLLRTYQYCYGISDYFHTLWEEMLNPQQKRAYARYALSRMVTFSQAGEFLKRLIMSG